MASRAGLAVLGLAALVVLGAGLLIARVTASDPPSLSECADQWNSGTNTLNQGKAAASSATTVIVDSSINKAGEGGCSVTVLEGTGRPWLLFATTLVQLRQSPGMWFAGTGQRWGADSPEPEKAPNATLRTDGTLVLSARQGFNG
jgi:hypothetical protein